MSKKVVIGLVIAVLGMGTYFIFKPKKSEHIEEIAADDTTAQEGKSILNENSNWEHSHLDAKRDADLASGAEQGKTSQHGSGNPILDKKVEKLIEVSGLEARWLNSKDQLENIVKNGLLTQFGEGEPWAEKLLEVFDKHFDVKQMAAEYEAEITKRLSEAEIDELIKTHEDPEVSEFVASLNNPDMTSNKEELEKFMMDYEKNPMPKERAAAIDKYFETNMAYGSKNIPKTFTATFSGVTKAVEAELKNRDTTNPSDGTKTLVEVNKSFTEFEQNMSGPNAAALMEQLKKQSKQVIAFHSRNQSTDKLKAITDKLGSSPVQKSQEAQADVAMRHAMEALSEVGKATANQIINQNPAN